MLLAPLICRFTRVSSNARRSATLSGWRCGVLRSRDGAMSGRRLIHPPSPCETFHTMTRRSVRWRHFAGKRHKYDAMRRLADCTDGSLAGRRPSSSAQVCHTLSVHGRAAIRAVDITVEGTTSRLRVERLAEVSPRSTCIVALPQCRIEGGRTRIGAHT